MLAQRIRTAHSISGSGSVPEGAIEEIALPLKCLPVEWLKAALSRKEKFANSFNEEGPFLAAAHVMLDPAMAVAPHYNVRGYPTTLFLDANGVLQDMHFGEIAPEGLNASIDNLKQ